MIIDQGHLCSEVYLNVRLIIKIGFAVWLKVGLWYDNHSIFRGWFQVKGWVYGVNLNTVRHDCIPLNLATHFYNCHWPSMFMVKNPEMARSCRFQFAISTWVA